ncbi:MAG: hypothetical protein NT011_01365 [Kiritimatiellaeota bacterium]|nr:hypothetical protein [Kiritimatiellota bacterium]
MVNIKKRIAIALVAGVVTGGYCAGSVLLNPPPHVKPELWFVAMIFYGRVLQGFVIGIADGIRLHWAIRGAILGLIFSLMLAIVPLNSGNMRGATMLLIFGIFYGIITDAVATWAAKAKADQGHIDTK